MRICFLTPDPDYEEDWSVLKADYLRLFGADTQFRSWTAPGDLTPFAIVLPMIAWGYQRDCPQWFALLDRMEAEGLPVINPVRVLRWNTDKNYLIELADQDVPIVPTRLTYALGYDDLVFVRECLSCDKLVIKPPVSGGADGTYLLELVDPIPANAMGKPMMVQPYFPSIATEGEFSLFYFNGHFSHAIIKRPAAGDFRVQDQFGGYEAAVIAPDEAKALAVSALAATDRITKCGALAYARVDMVRDDAGVFRLMELELIEPSLFLHFANDKGAAFAGAMVKAMRPA
jgi:glutathione synthase/RimK-type ligase-like ATP-grasp enzyme